MRLRIPGDFIIIAIIEKGVVCYEKNWKILLFAGVIVLFLIGSAILSYLSGRVPANDISVTGNTAGNLNNGGLFAESEGRVYFSNAYDGGCLYSMNSDETDLKSSEALL